MPTLSNFIVQYQQQCITNATALATMQLLPSTDTYVTFLNAIDEITTIPVTKLISSQFDFIKSNAMLFNGLDLSLFLLEHICVTCKSRYKRLQRDQIGRRVLNSYMHIFEYYIQCNINNATINLNELNNKLEIGLSKLLHATIWKELSVILKNNVARFVHTICNSDGGDNNRRNVSEYILANNKMLLQILLIGGGIKKIMKQILPRRKLLRVMKTYVQTV